MTERPQGAGVEGARRPIKSRSNRIIQQLARRMAEAGISPNAISMASVVLAVLAAVSLLLVPGGVGLVLCAIGIQLRLLCNVIDGLVAVEHARKTPSGALFNEVPDRISDSVLLVALGHAIGMPWLGWLAAVLAIFTAYIRVLGGSLGLAQNFQGPMAKSQRMAAMTLGCLVGAVEWHLNHSLHALHAAAWIIVLGSTLTCWARLDAISMALNGFRPGPSGH
ncbi:MAG: CDP-alcohol phosphatidyltransferase family protein [Lautropia sp.]|nr:CDP-alcohol phosphatidyltransferase family protein [Lautropia sp.]